MKKRILLIISILSIVAALTLTLAVPIAATTVSSPPHGGTIDVDTEDNGDGTVTATVKVTDADQNVGDILTITSVSLTIYHNGGSPPEEIQVYALPSPLPTLTYLGDTISFVFVFSTRPGDDNPIDLYAEVTGEDSGIPKHPFFMLTFPATSPWTLPELPAGILFGIGSLGLGGFIWLNRRKSVAKA